MENLSSSLVNTYYQIYEPNEKLEDPYLDVYTFELKQRAIETVILPEYTDLVMEISIVDSAGDALKTKTVTATDGTQTAATTKCVPENCILYSFWKNQRIFCNNTLISDSFDLYHHKSYINILLSASNSCKKSLGPVFGYYKDDYEKDVAQNRAVISKIERSANSKKFIVRGRLFNDLFVQNTPIISADLLMKFYRNDYKIMCHGDSKIKVHDIKIHALCATLDPQKAISLNKNLISQAQIYDTNEIELNFFELKDDFNHGVLKNLTSGSMPHYVIVCFQKTTTFRGAFDEYCFKYEDPGIKDIYLSNFDKKYPLNQPYSFESVNTDYCSAYKSVFDQSKIDSIDFDISEFNNGYFLLAFDLTKSFTYGETNNSSGFNTQELQLHVSMHTPITGYTCILYMSRSKKISINSLRQCLVSY